MSAAAARRTLAPLAVVTAAAFVFALLLVLVRLQWALIAMAVVVLAIRRRWWPGRRGTT